VNRHAEALVRRPLSLLVAAASLAALGSAAAPAASATTILYEAIDLGDSTPGEDLWLYRYRVSDATFGAGTGFSIFFELGSAESLAAGTPANADWDVLAVQPDAALVSDGFLDALALAGPASLVGVFEVSFVWLGAGTPGSQPFVLYDTSFQTIESGETLPIPEPATLAGVALGVAALAARRRARC
jgi:hypothetical protein